MSDPLPMVFRNARYERQFVDLARMIAELSVAVNVLAGAHNALVEMLAKVLDADANIPSLPKSSTRAFGRPS